LVFYSRDNESESQRFKTTASERINNVKKILRFKLDDDKAIFRAHGEGKTVRLGQNMITFLLSAEATEGKYSVTEFAAAPPPAPGAPLHIHKDANEAMYVLEGSFQVSIEDKEIPAAEGSFVLVRKGTLHTITNMGQRVGRLLIFLTPPGFERYWEEMSRLLEVTNGKPDQNQVLVLQEKYHMDMKGKARQFS
jgi:mannose-6-phosphate isomerase-like protein (cupin superfamily)